MIFPAGSTDEMQLFHLNPTLIRSQGVMVRMYVSGQQEESHHLPTC